MIASDEWPKVPRTSTGRSALSRCELWGAPVELEGVHVGQLQLQTEVVLQAAFYAAPIIYPPSMVPAKYARYLLLNPMAQIIQDARYALVSDQTDTIAQLFGTPWVRVIPVGITFVLVVASVIFFRRQSPSFAEEA